MKQIIPLFFAVFLMVGFSGCSKDDKPVKVKGITLSETKLEVLDSGRSGRLIITFEPSNATNRSVTWTSSNTDVATVAAGTVSGVSVGTAIITATTADGGYIATCTVTVIPTRVDSVRLRNTATVFFEETETLTAIISPAAATNKNVTWASSNPAVVSIDATGKITGESMGEAIITVTTEDGAKTANSTVYVVTPTFDYGIVIDNIRWATRNVDTFGTFTQKPEDAGLFYQWNRDTPDWTAGWNGNNAATWENMNNPCPTGWRVPTEAEFVSLRTSGHVWSANWEDTGVRGSAFGGTNNPVFLPAAGLRDFNNGAVNNVGTQGYYWSATTNPTGNVRPVFFNITGSTAGTGSSYRANGFSIRCVAE